MSSDLVVLARRRPDVHAIVDGLIALGEQVEMRGGEPRPTLLYDSSRRLLVTIEDPVLVLAPGEVERLLGAEFAGRVTDTVWWVDVRAVADIPEAEELARKVAEAFSHYLGGTVYPDGAPEAPAKSWKATGGGTQESPGGADADGAAYSGGVIKG
ncbi:hypothetical protein J4573_45090 [Actinomadura barringtoniae]|uniref:Uncharacterized protein n=1 Tax=Actinomadura barringtoniae TaxID=1427535 RepID=A0A939T9J4_9ACTN|nr:hypothetical protein [Actinomadura barringtoniae]MBO2454329.1 hypothetical protein [Actinomadura barringtoniae]